MIFLVNNKEFFAKLKEFSAKLKIRAKKITPIVSRTLKKQACTNYPQKGRLGVLTKR